MRRFINLFVFVLVIGGGVGLFFVFARNVRHAAALQQCWNNMRQLGITFEAYHDCKKRFPTGTSGNSDLPPEKRFSWLIEIHPVYSEAGFQTLFDRTKAWDVAPNIPPRCKVFDCS